MHHKVVLIITLGVVLAGLFWWGLSGEPTSDSLITTQTAEGTTPAERNVVDTLLQLRAVSLSGTIFSDPAFISLRDFGTQIIPEPVGRPNPFAPVASTPVSTSTEAASQQGKDLFAPRR